MKCLDRWWYCLQPPTIPIFSRAFASFRLFFFSRWCCNEVIVYTQSFSTVNSEAVLSSLDPQRKPIMCGKIDSWGILCVPFLFSWQMLNDEKHPKKSINKQFNKKNPIINNHFNVAVNSFCFVLVWFSLHARTGPLLSPLGAIWNTFWFVQLMHSSCSFISLFYHLSASSSVSVSSVTLKACVNRIRWIM